MDMWKANLLIGLLFIAGCHAHRPDFLTRVREDCAAGDQWACDLLDAFQRPPPLDDTELPDSVQDDLDAIQKGMDRARSAPRVGHPFVPPIAAELPTFATITTFLPLFNHPAEESVIGQEAKLRSTYP